MSMREFVTWMVRSAYAQTRDHDLVHIHGVYAVTDVTCEVHDVALGYSGRLATAVSSVFFTNRVVYNVSLDGVMLRKATWGEVVAHHHKFMCGMLSVTVDECGSSLAMRFGLEILEPPARHQLTISSPSDGHSAVARCRLC